MGSSGLPSFMEARLLRFDRLGSALRALLFIFLCLLALMEGGFTELPTGRGSWRGNCPLDYILPARTLILDGWEEGITLNALNQRFD